MNRARTVNEGRLTDFLLGLFLIAATLAAYQLVWRAGYVWDDDVYVTANPLLTAPDGLRRIWFSLDSPSQYFPLVYSVFRLEHALWGFNPAGYHWVNISLHAANALLLWRLLRLLRIPGAWLAAALFALHPVQVESVAWITELKNVLMGFFFLLALICWARFIKKDTRARAAYYAAALICYAFALFSKTTACTLPAALLLLLWLKRKPITLARWAQVAPFVILGGAMGVVTMWWERYHQGTQGQTFAVAFPERILIASRALWFYLGKLIWPNELCFSYPRWPVSVTNPLAYVWIGVTLAAVLAIWFLRRRTGRSVETAMLFFVATLSPVLGFIMLYTFRYTWVADHYQYLACIGPLSLFAAGVDLAAVRFGRAGHWLVAIAGAALLSALGARTWKQGAIYANAETLWRASIATNPQSWLAHNNLGLLIERRSQLHDSLAEYERAVELEPDYAEAHNNLANTYAQLGRREDAVIEYKKAIALHPQLAAAHANLASSLLQLDRVDEAREHLQQALALGLRDAETERSLGIVLARSQQAQEAIEHWKRALEINPNDAELQGTVGRALAKGDQVEAAVPYLRSAAQLAPENAQAHYNYATGLSLSGRLTEAIEEYREALRILPEYSEAHMNLATSYVQSGRLDEAVAEYERTLELKPEYIRAHKNLAVLLRHLGRNEEAVAHEERAAVLELQSGVTPAP
ncbi:MAG: tetratricopeptide repeat protein [Verrucomicrobiota bacterium]|nr:tetratricopeptide repeat protein [Verrucomicrobiota bacterium]